MTDTEQLKSRIDDALARIRVQAAQASQIERKLKEVETRRANDIKELDTLVEQLKPLVGEN